VGCAAPLVKRLVINGPRVRSDTGGHVECVIIIRGNVGAVLQARAPHAHCFDPAVARNLNRCLEEAELDAFQLLRRNRLWEGSQHVESEFERDACFRRGRPVGSSLKAQGRQTGCWRRTFPTPAIPSY
jgi:hypothetical protein